MDSGGLIILLIICACLISALYFCFKLIELRKSSSSDKEKFKENLSGLFISLIVAVVFTISLYG